MIINLFFSLLYILVSKFVCLNNNEIAELTMNMNQKFDILDSNNYVCNYNFNDAIIQKTLFVGNVYEEILYSSNKYIFYFNEIDAKNNNLYFHFYPLDDCHIKISPNDTSVKIEPRSNYNNKLFYAQINSGKMLDSISFKIEPINYLNKDNNSTCHLIINSFNGNNDNIPKLNLLEKSPTFLHFDKNIKKIRLFYDKQKEIIEPIVFSFFIKDKVKFNVAFENAGLTKTQTISYIDKFIITKDLISSNENISILLTLKEEEKESDLIVRVIGDNSKFYYLQRNFLNLEFILSEEKTQYYYMEVYKNEEGEIMLHDKRKKGKLASKIFNEDRPPKESDFKKISNEFEEFDEFDIYSQRLSFNTTECKIYKKCLLLITYFGSNNLLNVIGTEYTLLTRIWDKFEAIPQIVNIPLNEYIFGYFDENSVNYHYYTVFNPEKSENITLEIHGAGINVYKINGIKKINKKSKGIFYLNFENGSKIKTLKKGDKNQYISLSIFRKNLNLNSRIIYYYFRILQSDSTNKNIIYPLDSNVENYCRSELILEQYSSYFLLKNDYNELSHNNLIINELHDYAENYSKVIISKKNEDYYSINLNDKSFDSFSTNMDIGNITNDYYVIIKINSKDKRNLTILSGFSETEPSIQIYSYKLINFYKRKEIYYNFGNKAKQFKLRLINNMPERNKLKTSFFKNNNTIDNVYNNFGKQFSCLLEKYDKLKFSCENKSIIYVKFDYKKEREYLIEINQYNSFISLEKKTFPIILYMKDFYNSNLDLNIYYEHNNASLDIIGYIADYHDIGTLDKEKDKKYIDYHHLIKGIYDNSTQTGVIEFNNNNDFKTNSKDIYYVIEINSYSPNVIPDSNDSNIFIYATPKEKKGYNIPSGKYIRGIFNLTENVTQQIYYTEPYKNISNIKTIIEFSSNNKNVEILFDKKNISKNYSEKYAQIYIVEDIINNFTVRLKDNDNKTINNSLIVNYIFKYYYSDIYYNTSNSSNVNCIYTNKTKKDERNITIKCNNSQENNSNINYSYSLRLYQKDKKIQDEELNTTAITFSEIFYFNKIQTNDSEFNFTVNDISIKTDYVAILFIKYYYNNQPIYKIHDFIINVKDSINYFTILIIAGPGCVILIIIILIIYLVKMKKKNKELEERVNSISFGVEDTNTELSDDDDLNNRKVSYV